mmetsp:Transcript_17748/g.28915  ORF Transcript_17748/g.28915 Transcript_17748/m.28915 type:complete len:325 (-) Transcript_17748:618-1592(-)
MGFTRPLSIAGPPLPLSREDDEQGGFGGRSRRFKIRAWRCKMLVAILSLIFLYTAFSWRAKAWGSLPLGSPSVVTVPLLNDNYGYLIVCPKEKVCAVVDPVEPKKILAAAKKEGVDITHILTTHSHWDHAGGNKDLIKSLKDQGKSVIVVGGAKDGIPGVTKEVKEGDEFKIGTSVEVKVLDTPCHTQGHVCFYCTKADAKEKSEGGAVFTGDTMFVGGCGNFNSGSPEQMYSNFMKLGKLPKDTLVYCGHEYTLKNLAYASYADPENVELKERVKWAEERRKAGLPTVPSTIKDEWETNPFLRVDTETIRKYAKTTDGAKAMK